jgi:hypothetical protein
VAFYLRPWKSLDRSARRYIRALDGAIPDGAAVIGDFTIEMPLLYANRVEGWKPGCVWHLVDGATADDIVAWITEALAEGRRVFLLDDKPYYFPTDIERRWELVPTEVESLREVRSRRIRARRGSVAQSFRTMRG